MRGCVVSQMENTYSVKGSGGQTFEGDAGKVVSGGKPESSMDNPLAQGNGRESPSGQLSNRPGSPVGGSSPNNGNGTNRSNSPFDSPNGPRGTRCASTMASTPVGLPPTAR